MSTYHHKICGGVIVDDPDRPAQTFGPFGEYAITATVQPQKCSKCGLQLPLNIDSLITESPSSLCPKPLRP